MKIYTKQGDEGETGLWGNKRVPKDDARIRAYGTFDELNASLGVLLCETGVPGDLRDSFLRIQNELFLLGSELATPSGKSVPGPTLEPRHIEQLEKEIDTMEASLPPLQHFVLPGGHRAASLTHLSRTVCRRAERELISLHHVEPVRSVVLQYANRLSDYFFVCARFLNSINGSAETFWIPRAKPKS